MPELIVETRSLAYNLACCGSLRLDAAPGGGVPVGTDDHWIALRGDAVILEESGESLTIPCGPLPPWLSPLGGPLRIGSWRDRALRVFATDPEATVPPPFAVEPFSTVTPRATDDVITVCGIGRQILQWREQSRFCPSCGGATERSGPGWGAKCFTCGMKQFPTAAPCAIVLVKRGREVLLIHKPAWRDGRYSIPAGFAEIGESLEECAAREVEEETGILIGDLRYVGSQNWPFPASLMAGFVAEYAGGEIRIQQEEIDDARWFPMDRLPLLPSRRSIARWIIEQGCRG